MHSTESRSLGEYYAENAAVLGAAPDVSLPLMRALLEGVHRCSAEPAGVTYADVTAGALPATWCVPTSIDASRVILYFHGGGFVLQSRHSHRKLAGHLAAAAGARVLVVDYRQAPENPFPAQLEDASTVYSWLLDQGIDSRHIALAGDSAGANLAVTTALAARDKGLDLPVAIVALSPWFDMENTSSTLDSNAAHDALVQRALVEQMATMFLGPNGSARDPLANPLYADLVGLPPIYISAGGHEALLDDGVRFADRAEKAGVAVTMEIEPEQQHVFHFMAGNAPEADKALAAAAEWLVVQMDYAEEPSSAR
ncbi:alpha/beta hydrolase [Rhodococcus erythropolis]|uniref:alpha/beta hydrolase n=1 Tax=Rhodococcus erythropolis TaxID=1833 RepID=UPI002948C553|nr:alpha/beta hydrolase [Rhodococcus erythropolis]MDV6212706.1 alpha/beta hydrolase [Rhodococcus erythropolis]